MGKKLYVLGRWADLSDRSMERILGRNEMVLDMMISHVDGTQSLRVFNIDFGVQQRALHFTQVVNRFYKFRSRLDALGLQVHCVGTFAVITGQDVPAKLLESNRTAVH